MNGRWVVCAAVGVLCGYLSGYVIGHTRTNYAVIAQDGRAGWFGSGPGAAAVVAALVAVAVVVVLGRFRARYLVAVAAGLAGLAMVVAIAALQTVGTWSEPWVLGSVGAGLLAAVAVVRSAGQVWFVVGSVTAVLYGARIDASVAVPRRYADYLPTRTVPDLPDSWPLLVAATIALLTAGFVIGRERIEPVTDRRAVLVGVTVPVAIGALILIAGLLPGNPSITVAVAAVAGTAVVSWWLPPPDRIFTLAMLAVSAAIAVDPIPESGPDRVGLTIQIGGLVLGALVAMLGRFSDSDTGAMDATVRTTSGPMRLVPRTNGDAVRRAPGTWTVVGIAALAAVTMSAIMPTSAAVIPELAYRFVLPVAIGCTLGSCLPVAPMTVLAISVFPVVARLFENSRVGTEFGWTAYLPDPDELARHPTPATIAATLVIAGCAALMLLLRRVSPVRTRVG